MLIIISIILTAAAAVLLLYYFFRRKGMKEQILSHLERLAATMQMTSARISTIPMTLSGRYRTYQMLIECLLKKIDGRKKQCWVISAAIGNIADRFYLQSESQEGKLRKIISLDLMTTGDELFDRQVMVFSSNTNLARRVFNPYMRHSFLWADFKDFALDVRGTSAVLELYVDELTNARYIRHALEVFSEFLNVLESV